VYNFIVGGFVPGTDIQISFQAYLAVMTVLLGVVAITYLELRHRNVRKAARSLIRQPLHANQLHLRAL
jgi:hypothetical protein